MYRPNDKFPDIKVKKQTAFFLSNVKLCSNVIGALQSHMKPSKPHDPKTKHNRSREVRKKVVLNS